MSAPHEIKRPGHRFPWFENADQSSLLVGIMVVLALLTIYLTTREYPANPPVNAVHNDLNQVTPAKVRL